MSTRRRVGLGILSVISLYIFVYTFVFDPAALMHIGLGVLISALFMRLTLGISLTKWPNHGKMMYKNGKHDMLYD